jgi:hypothetical protein
MVLSNFDDNEGHIVGERAVLPRGRALTDRRFHSALGGVSRFRNKPWIKSKP